MPVVPARFRRIKGLSLVEVVVAMAILSVVLLGTMSLFQTSMVATTRSRQQLRASRLAQMISTATRGMNFYHIVPRSTAIPLFVDSSQPNFGLATGAVYGSTTTPKAFPEMAILRQLNDSVVKAGFSHFSIDVTFMRRKLTAVAGSGTYEGDLVPFVDGNGDFIDDFDPNIRFQNLNGVDDSDYYDYTIDSDGIVDKSEAPDTHVKKLAVRIWKGRNVVALEEGQLLSAEQFSGTQKRSAEAALTLLVNSPPSNSILFSKTSSYQADSQGFTSVSGHALPPYPGGHVAVQADSTMALTITGVSAPSAAVTFYLGSPGSATRDPATTTINTATDGTFSIFANTISGMLQPGYNRIFGQTIKGVLTSPYVSLDVLLDRTPPQIQSRLPQAFAGPETRLRTRTPYIGAQLVDLDPSTTVVSGIDAAVNFIHVIGTGPGIRGCPCITRYNPVTGEISYVREDYHIPPRVRANESATVYIGAGDFAHYRTTASWTFRIANNPVFNTESSSPTITEISPSSGAINVPPLPTFRCKFEDLETGINPLTIELTVRQRATGTDVISVSKDDTPEPSRIGDYFDPRTGYFVYTHNTPLADGVYDCVLKVRNWKKGDPDEDPEDGDPAAQGEFIWAFTVGP